MGEVCHLVSKSKKEFDYEFIILEENKNTTGRLEPGAVQTMPCADIRRIKLSFSDGSEVQTGLLSTNSVYKVGPHQISVDNGNVTVQEVGDDKIIIIVVSVVVVILILTAFLIAYFVDRKHHSTAVEDVL